MADNTFNFDLDAPAVPTLTLDPAPAQEQAQPKQPEPAAAPAAQDMRRPARRRSVPSPKQLFPRCPPRTWAKWAI